MKKKILQINTVYATGSTGKITAGLYADALEKGYEVYVAYGRGNSPLVNGINGFLVGDKIDFSIHVLSNFVRGNSGFASTRKTKKLLRWIDEIKPDIIHIHNIHGFFINVRILFEYIKEKKIPIIWTLHDCWAFTGQCAYFDLVNCNKWITGCYDCPIYKSDYPYSLFKDNSVSNYLNKRESFTEVENLKIITPSKWLEELVKKSFLKDYQIKTITNGVNLNIFNKNNDVSLLLDKYHKYNLSSRKVILGVANVWLDQKGYTYMLELSNYFNNDNGYLIVLVGVSKSQKRFILSKYGMNILPILKTENQNELALWYNIAHVYVNPTLQDNYPTTNLEAQACGTPVVTFDVGGSPETLLVNSLPNKVVEKGNIEALVGAVKNITEYVYPEDDELLCLSDRRLSEKYMDVYEEVLKSL